MIIKADGRKERFTKSKLFDSLCYSGENYTRRELRELQDKITTLLALDDDIQTSDIIRSIELACVQLGMEDLYEKYIINRHQRDEVRTFNSEIFNDIKDVIQNEDFSNANAAVKTPTSIKDRVAARTMKWLYFKTVDKRFKDAHEQGLIHAHDADYAFNSIAMNCLTLNTPELIKNGFAADQVPILPPKHLASAGALCAIACQLASNDMFGGCNLGDYDTAIKPIVKMERGNYRNEIIDLVGEEEYLKKCVVYNQKIEERLDKEIYQMNQALIYNLNSLRSRSGGQLPFSSLNFGLDIDPDAIKVSSSLLKAFDDGLGKEHRIPLFPNLCFGLKKGINTEPNDPGYKLYQQACELASRKLQPNFVNQDCSMNEGAEPGNWVQSMGCRTRIWGNVNGKKTSMGRGNVFPVSINVPYIALQSKNVEDFMKRFNDVLDLCRDQLMDRFSGLKNFKIQTIPFNGKYGWLNAKELSQNDTVDNLAKQGTFAIGLVGIAEACKALFGKHHGEAGEVYAWVKDILLPFYLNKINEYTKETGLNFSTYATPAESTAGKFAKCIHKKFGKSIVKKDYLTNGFHIPVDFDIVASKKMELEGPLHKFFTGGVISYVEFDGVPTDKKIIETYNRVAIESDMHYWAFNLPLDQCAECGYTNVIPDECPNCKSKMINRYRRITGYVVLAWDGEFQVSRINDGKRAEIKDRVAHA